MKKALIVAAAFCTGLGSFSTFAQTRYTVTKVDTSGLAGFAHAFEGNAINSGADVVGSYFFYHSGVGFKRHGFGRINGITVDMPNIYFCSVTATRPDACHTMAYGINDSDVAVGGTWVRSAYGSPSSYWPQAFIRRTGLLEEFMPGFNWSYARDINNTHFAVGNYRPASYADRAFVHHKNNTGYSASVKDLSTLAGSGNNFDSRANAINNQNVIVGSSEISDGVQRATMWTFTKLALGTVGGATHR